MNKNTFPALATIPDQEMACYKDIALGGCPPGLDHDLVVKVATYKEDAMFR